MTDNEVKWVIVGKLLRRNLMAVKGEQWEVLYEGTVDISVAMSLQGTGSYYRPVSYTDAFVTEGTVYRMTVNGVSEIFQPKVRELFDADGELIGYSQVIGNAYHADYKRFDDTGYDYAMSSSAGISGKVTSFYARNFGTYTVKIERLVRA